MNLRYFRSPDPEKASLPFAEAVQFGDTLYLSGQLGTLPGTLSLASGGIVPETKQLLQNIRDVLERRGSSLRNVIKCTVFLADMNEWARFNEVYREFFQDRLPARSALGANGLAMGARVEMECIAAVSAG